MIVDFHTHIFPEKIAERALAKLAVTCDMKPCFNGCAEGLRGSMQEAGIDISIILPVVTDVRQFDSITRFAAAINETYREADSCRLISFGGIHLNDPAYKEHLLRLKQEGFRGFKIHPNYQEVDFNDIRTKRILSYASEIDLPILTHAGSDPVTPAHEYCTPDMILDVLKDVHPKNLILAHMGSNLNYNEAEEKLMGRDVYLDTAWTIIGIDPKQFVRMVRKHGANRILFASDCPWGSQSACVKALRESELTDSEKELIFSGNAVRFLGL